MCAEGVSFSRWQRGGRRSWESESGLATDQFSARSYSAERKKIGSPILPDGADHRFRRVDIPTARFESLMDRSIDRERRSTEICTQETEISTCTRSEQMRRRDRDSRIGTRIRSRWARGRRRKAVRSVVPLPRKGRGLGRLRWRRRGGCVRGGRRAFARGACRNFFSQVRAGGWFQTDFICLPPAFASSAGSGRCGGSWCFWRPR